MRTVPVDEDDLMIPGASHLAESFLGTVLELERRSGLGLGFDVVDSGGRLRLQAPVRFRDGGRPRPMSSRSAPTPSGRGSTRGGCWP